MEQRVEPRWRNKKAHEVTLALQGEIVELEKLIMQKKTQNQIGQQTEQQLRTEHVGLEEQLSQLQE